MLRKPNALFLRILLPLAAALLVAVGPRTARALTEYSGDVFAEDTYISGDGASRNLLQSGVNLSIKPAIKKHLDARLNLRLDYTNADGKWLWNVSPIGNLSVDLRAEDYSLNLRHARTITVTTAAELVENDTYRVAATIFPEYWPRITTSYSRREQRLENSDGSTSDLYSLFADYDYRHLNLRGGYNHQKRSSAGSASIVTDTFLIGGGVNLEVLTGAVVTGEFDLSRYDSEAQVGPDTASTNYATRLGLDVRRSQWYGFTGNFTRDQTDSDSDNLGDISTVSQYFDLTGTLYPFYGMRLWTTIGNRSFDDFEGNRDIDYLTVGGAWNRHVTDEIRFNLTGTHIRESGTDQGKNTRDAVGLTTIFDVIPNALLRLGLNITRNDVPSFVSAKGYDASGPLITRSEFDDRPAGFTFLDTDNNDVYTKNSGLGDWSEPVHIEPPPDQRFLINRTVQANLRPTSRVNIALFYSFSGSSSRLDLLKVETQTVNGSLSYQANRRTSYSLTGNFSDSKTSSSRYAVTAGINYRFRRGHRINLTYGRRTGAGAGSDLFTSSLRLVLRKRSSLETVYSVSELFENDRDHSFRVRYRHGF